MLVIGTDGAANNVGIYNGAQRLTELKFGFPLSHFNCLYHAAERPLRKLQEVLDGKTNGPVTTTGEIGEGQKRLDDFQSMHLHIAVQVMMVGTLPMTIQARLVFSLTSYKTVQIS